jgi:hypothetical protein
VKLADLPSSDVWKAYVDAYIHPTLGYFILVFEKQLVIWDIKNNQTRPFATIGHWNDSGYALDQAQYSSVWCDRDILMASIRYGSAPMSDSGTSVAMWQWYNIRAPATKILSGSGGGGTCQWVAVASPNNAHLFATQNATAQRFVWVTDLLGGSPGSIRLDNEPVALRSYDPIWGKWWDDLTTQIRRRLDQLRAQQARATKATTAVKPKTTNSSR